MKRSIYLVVLLSIFYVNVKANDYALGGRISNQFGITFKYNYTHNIWLEGIVDIENHSLTTTGLYELYFSTPFSNNFNWFAGGGIYVGYWGYQNTSNGYAGIKGVAGLCYNFRDMPIDISIDWMPAMQVVSDFNTDFNIFGLSVRYTF